MKKILTLLAIATGFAVMAPTASQARDHDHGHGSSRSFSHTCNKCGTPTYRERAVVGRDRHGHLVYGWRTIGHACRPSHAHNHGGRPGAHLGFPGLHLDLGRGRR